MVSKLQRSTSLLVLVVSAGACQPDFPARASVVNEQRVLAVRSEPAEAAPKANVQFRALVVDGNGNLQSPDIAWSFCTAAKPVSETNDVSAKCLALSGPDFIDVGQGPSANGAIPEVACRQFGPDVPQTKPGEPQGRPADADGTGGFFQPLRLIVATPSGPLLSLGEVRISCGLPSATGEQDKDFKVRNKLNQNPLLSQASILRGGVQLQLSDVPVTLNAGEVVTLRAEWPACGQAANCGDGMCTSGESNEICPADCQAPGGQLPVGCSGPEYFAYYDPATRSVVDRREAMRVSWFATAGTFRDDHSGRREDEQDLFTDNQWTAPKSPGLVHLWFVLRDSRGGTDWGSYTIDVR